ncbi:MAG: hypothetical protein LBP51_07455, partial [Deferribacteraceae bacterium]|nr:hypothetical protein [Deferribacteraceae bacterium]
MGYLRFKITPKSAFGTLPASDTLFGQLCCTLRLLGEDLDALLKGYAEDPFAVLSNMLPLDLGSLPPLPKAHTEESERLMGERKKLKKLNMAAIPNI